MNPEKKEIILTEIDHWRTGRLLPEQYCDFLENLYTDEHVQSSKNVFSITQIRQGNVKTWLLGFGIISLIFIIGLYFSSFPWPLQMAISLLLTSTCYTVAAVWRPRRKLAALVMSSMGSFLLLASGSWILSLQGWHSVPAVAALLGICAVAWGAAGFFLNLGIIHFCGYVCAMLLYAYLFGHFHPEASWLLLQLLWLPISVVMIWLSWLTHHRIKRLSPVYFAVGLTVWFMSEADAFLLRQNVSQGFVLLCLVKLAIAFVMLFLFRKKWIAWVAS
ncbi:hypothetical protein DCC85_14995 [Paenibacillus sp. CAA11]|uniref:hypothetical protein n=1 Tax=Paenibacillus sp. CAA11 TaxID=1532905 RepID=UPI000D3D8D0B|nr:hypothetical protein [Paenibacillus sp. CAA11]AWB45396.1 hypothetical protein DCC85_14995 [Paenibacillus sp. CAA11]